MKKISLYISTLMLIAALFGCGEDRTHEFYEMTEENQWTFSKMKEVYLWADSIKTPSRQEFFATTSKFFTSLKYKGDAASFFTDTVSAGSYGMTFALMRDPIGVRPSKTYALALFVEPASPAAEAGIERGTWISSVGGKSLSISSAAMLQQGDATDIVTERMEFDEETMRYSWSVADTLHMQRSTENEVCNIYDSSIYTVRDSRIGYLVVNSFNGDDFAVKANGAVQYFEAENVDAVIIDLRYNSGGSISNAASLAANFVPAPLVGTPFATLQGNGEEVDTVYNYPTPAAALDGKKLYIITGNATKGTAELFVKSLNDSKGVYEVNVIGERTAGSNVMVEKFLSPYGFAINPATAYIHTADGTRLPASGVQPQYNANELAQKTCIYPLGNEQEYILYSTLYLYVNGTLPVDAPAIRHNVHCSSHSVPFIR